MCNGFEKILHDISKRRSPGQEMPTTQHKSVNVDNNASPNWILISVMVVPYSGKMFVCRRIVLRRPIAVTVRSAGNGFEFTSIGIDVNFEHDDDTQ